MSQFQNKAIYILFCVIITSFISGCGLLDLFVDLRMIEFETTPGVPYTVLAGESDPVIVRFNTEMKHRETESALQVTSPAGVVEGDLFWMDRELYFVPASPWLAGYRYVLRISGTIYADDGRDLYVSRDVPFYAISRAELPFIVSVSPADGSSTKAFFRDEKILSFRFSLPMDRRSAEAAFSCDGLNGKTFLWLEDDHVLEIMSDNALVPWTGYRWSFTGMARSREGAPLSGNMTGRFITDEDRVFPQVVRVIPLLKGGGFLQEWGSWTPYSLNLDCGLGFDQGIGVEFNKPMDTEKLKTSFSFEPSLQGRVEIITPVTAVFIPDRNPEPGTVFTMKISGDARDIRGLRMGHEYSCIFGVEYPFLEISSLAFGNDSSFEFIGPDKFHVYHVESDKADNGVLRFTIRFSLPFTREAQMEVSRILLTPFFPGILASVDLRFANWLGPDRLHMEWEGLEGGKDGEPHYYKLALPGGRGGISDGKGSGFGEDQYFYLEVTEK